MTGVFRIGDKVSTSDDRTGTVVAITTLYTLDDGSLWNERLLKMVERIYTDDMIVDELCQTLDTTRKELTTTFRKREIVNKRQVIIYILRKYFGWTLSHIGKMFKKDHSTVVHSVQVVEDLLEVNDAIFSSMIQELDSTAKHILESKKDE